MRSHTVVSMTGRAFRQGLRTTCIGITPNLYALVSADDETNGVWLVSQNGQSVEQLVTLPPGSFPNDLIVDATGPILVTDSIGGRIFVVEAMGGTGTEEVWAEDALLLGNVDDPGPLGQPIDANGIALSPAGDAVYVSMLDTGRLVRIPLNPDGSAGAVTLVAEDPALVGSDGIDVGPDGTIYVSLNGQHQIATVDPATGRVAVVASGPSSTVWRSYVSARMPARST